MVDNDPYGSTLSRKTPFVKIEDYNPDCNESFSKYFTDSKSRVEFRGVMQVKGIGVIVFHTTLSNPSFKNMGQLTMSILTRDEVGFCPDL